jgi:hypothetical protein
MTHQANELEREPPRLLHYDVATLGMPRIEVRRPHLTPRRELLGTAQQR